jgi:DNA-binding transcriptional ArsR family regulator
MTSTQSSIKDDLCTRVRPRILKLLLELQMLNVSDIAAKVGVNYVSASTHLEALEDADVLSHTMFGKRIRYYRLKESVRANAVKKLIEAWHSAYNCYS